MKTTIITSVIAGVLLTIFSYHAYTVYSMKKAVITQGQAIAQIVDFINKNTQK